MSCACSSGTSTATPTHHLRYSGSVKEREKRRERENLIDNTDPNSAGSIEFLTKKHRTARQGATATNEMIRSQWQDKGIGKLGQ